MQVHVIRTQPYYKRSARVLEKEISSSEVHKGTMNIYHTISTSVISKCTALVSMRGKRGYNFASVRTIQSDYMSEKD